MKNQRRGQSLVELLVAIAVASLMLPAIIVGFVATRQGRVQQRERFTATLLAQEAQEAVRIIRDRDWNNIAQNGTYHPVVTNNQWVLSAGSETVDEFARSIAIADASRNASGDIIESGGSLDPSTKKVTITVSWSALFPSNVTTTTYLTRHTYKSYIQTTQADFDAGTLTNTITTNLTGGEVTLGAGGRADWCSPNLSIASLDLPKQGVANAISAIEGRVFAGTGDNASGVSYATVNIANTNPPIATISGTYDGYKTNSIFGEANYAYLATDNNAKEIEIINLTTNPYSEAGYFNAPGNGNGNSIYVAGNVGYMTSANTFYTFDLTSKAGARSVLGSTTLTGTGVKTFVLGSYAYVALASTTQLQILDISNASSPTVVGQVQLPAAAGVDVFVNQTGTRAYLATATSVTYPEFFIIDIGIKTGNHTTALGTYDTAGMDPRGVTVVPGNIALVVGIGGTQQYQAINIVDETHPVHCTNSGRTGGLAITTGVHGIASVLEADGDAYSYIITGDASAELKIIEGGPGGKFSQSGTFVSTPFSASQSAAFNSIAFSVTTPGQTSVTLQVAGANPVNGSCTGAAYAFVGPDGTANTYFTGSGLIPFSPGPGFTNPAQCFAYKAYFSTSDLIQEPYLLDVTLNYSP